MAKRFSIRRVPGVGGIAIATFILLYVPVCVLVVNALNAGNVIGHWEGFSLRWFQAALANDAFRAAAANSLTIATVAGATATLCATMGALASTRAGRFKGARPIDLMLNQPLLVPEIVLAISLMLVLARIKAATGYHGMAYIIVAHITFCIPFAYMPIRARLEGMNLELETAALDLYASRLYTLRRVTLPMFAPGILAGFMLAFVISLDNVVVSNFVKSPGIETLPTYLLGELRRNLTSEIYAISSLLLFASVLVVAASWLLTRKKT